MKVTEMRRILAESGIQLTKSLGQNFLHDANQLRRIIRLAELSEGDSVLEVGPGLGPLTELLLTRCGRVLAIEKDGRLARWLQKRFADAPALELAHGDALEYLRRAKGRDWSQWKMVANLPYSVGSPILVEWALAEPKPAMTVVTLQWEVVNRIRASAGSRDYGVLSLLLQAGHVPVGSFRIPAACFFPRPEVDSACIALKRRRNPLLAGTDFPRFVRLVKAGFRQRRKIMLNLLKPLWPEPLLRECFAARGIDFQARAESVTLEQFAGLAQMLPNGRTSPPRNALNPDYAQGDMEEVFDVVNEQNEVIGRRPRSEVHRLRLMHRAVHVLVFDDAGRLFLQKRSPLKDCFPGKWDSSASGHLDAGESYDACAVREVREEIGLILNAVPERLFEIAACPETGQEFVRVYRCHSNGPFQMRKEEVSEGRWRSPAEVDQWTARSPDDFADGFLLVWRRYRAFCKTSR